MGEQQKMIELRPDRRLLDVNFGGYKLSLDPLPSYRHDLQSGVDHLIPSYDQYSFLHLKVFSLHNHLCGDPWSPDDVYFIDRKWKVNRNVTDVKSGHLKGTKEVWEIPASHPRQTGHYNPSLSFPAPEIALIADGTGFLHILNTPSRSAWKTELWKVAFSEEVFGSQESFVIVDSRLNTCEGKSELHCLLLRVDEAEEKEPQSNTRFQSILTWMVFIANEGGWSMSRSSKLACHGELDYIALEPDCTALYVACKNKIEFIYDSEHPVEQNKELLPSTEGEGNQMEKEGDGMEQEEMKEKKNYLWKQTVDDIEINFSLPQSVEKNEVVVSVKDKSISVKCRGSTLLTGDTWGHADPYLTSWTLENGRLRVTVTKAESGLMWQALVPTDSQGEEVLESALVEEVHQRLAHLCSDKEVTDVEQSSSFNSEQLEECDSGGTSNMLLRIDPNSHSVTHQATLSGHQTLFIARLTADEAPAICLRHDVDGCVWQPSHPPPSEASPTWPIVHVGTFNAFGYVQASKQQKKFSVSAPDLSFVAVCDAVRHIYVYRQPKAVKGELRNRRTGQTVNQTSQQQLFALPDGADTLGAHASNNWLFVLTASYLLALHINL